MPSQNPAAAKQKSASPNTGAQSTSKKKSKPNASIPAKVKGASSNFYLNKLLARGIENLSDDEKKELALLIKDSHRIKPVAKSKKNKSVFDSVTGHHEWLPTDRAEKIVSSTRVWACLYTALRSPTWLLVVNPERYCADATAYRNAVQDAAAHVANPLTKPQVPASKLGLVGHSGGLCEKGTQLTQWQSTWHDELRDLYDKHAPSNAYDAYWLDLRTFIGNTFLFVSAPTLPLGGANLGAASNDDVMKSIPWDLHLSGRGNPQGVAMATLYDVAQYLHGQWGTWLATLQNSFNAYRNM